MAETFDAILDSMKDPEILTRHDPRGMMALVLGFADQCRRVEAAARSFGAGWSPTAPIHNIVITGLGGSAIGADFARCLIDEGGTAPLTVNRDYTLPNWVGPNTLVIAASYSGNTEETLTAFEDAGAKGAQRAVVTSGGTLAQLAASDDVPAAIVPGGQPPRSATGFMFLPLLGFLANTGLLKANPFDDFDELLSTLDSQARRYGPEVSSTQNLAKQWAIQLHGKIPIIYGSQGYRGAVAVRWKGQFNENTKIAAFANVLPEQNHNEALAWVLAAKQASNWSVIFLRDEAEAEQSPKIAKRVEITKQLLGNGPEILELFSEGSSLLARIFSLAYFADFLTVYLAALYGICPTDMAALEYLKAEMAKL